MEGLVFVKHLAHGPRCTRWTALAACPRAAFCGRAFCSPLLLRTGTLNKLKLRQHGIVNFLSIDSWISHGTAYYCEFDFIPRQNDQRVWRCQIRLGSVLKTVWSGAPAPPSTVG